MKRKLTGVFAALTLILCHGAVLAGGNANFILGQRTLEEDEVWRSFAPDVDEQPTIGANIDFGEPDWPISLAVAIQGSGETDRDAVNGKIDAGILDLSFGVRWIGNRYGTTHPYVGAGVSHVFATLDSDDLIFADDDETDSSFGAYANAGIYWNIGERLNVGFDARWLRGTDLELELNDVLFETDADYFQVGMLIGVRWGAGASRRPPGDSRSVR